MACRLCERERPLKHSHILPELAYRPTYDATHTAVKYDLAKGRKGKLRKGFRERLFCGECEARFGEWEDYFAKVWLHHTTALRPKTVSGSLITIPGLDYAKFKLFHLSLIWRASVSSLDAFKNVRLGGQADRVRRLLLAGDPGPADRYPFFGMALREPLTGAFMDGLIHAPIKAKVDGHSAYMWLFAGVQWCYYFSSHANRSNALCTLSASGELVLGVQDWLDNLSVRDLASHLRAAGLNNAS